MSANRTQPPVSLLIHSNLYEIDPVLKPVLRQFWQAHSQYEDQLQAFGKWVGETLLPALWHLDHHSPPRHLYFSPFADRVDHVWLDPLQWQLMNQLHQFEMIADIWKSRSLMYHYALGYLLSDAGLYCIFTLTTQTAIILDKYGPLREAVPRLAGLQKPYAYGATFYTEATSGSDLSQNQTVAQRVGDHWVLTGEKYFTSNVGIADWALVTAFEKGVERHIKNLRLFVVPRYREGGEPNYRIRRLKPKVGSRLVPTGEIILDGAVGWHVGDLHQGIYYTVESLMYSRLANAVASMGLAMKAYLEAQAFAQQRVTFGKPIITHPLLHEEFEVWRRQLERSTALAFWAVALLDRCWRQSPPYSEEYQLARLITHIAKNRTAEQALAITQWAIEVYGGIGVTTDFLIERWHRETQVAIIWEGTSHIHALEMVEAIRRKQAGRLLIDYVRQQGCPAQELARLETLIQRIERESEERVQRQAKHLLRQLAEWLEHWLTA